MINRLTPDSTCLFFQKRSVASTVMYENLVKVRDLFSKQLKKTFFASDMPLWTLVGSYCFRGKLILLTECGNRPFTCIYPFFNYI